MQWWHNRFMNREELRVLFGSPSGVEVIPEFFGKLRIYFASGVLSALMPSVLDKAFKGKL